MNLIDHMANAIPHAPSFETAARLVCAVLRVELPHYHWTGVYMLDGEDLVLEAWSGDEATEHTKISIRRGLCGLAARENRAVVVRDVHEDPRYLACFSSTRSEIVVPIRDRQGQVIGEIDCDSNDIAAFHQTDLVLLEWLCERLSERWVAERSGKGQRSEMKDESRAGEESPAPPPGGGRGRTTSHL